jgi:hypothetical protein
MYGVKEIIKASNIFEYCVLNESIHMTSNDDLNEKVIEKYDLI